METDEDSCTSGMKGWLQKKRKHDGIYVRSGFMCAGHSSMCDGQCVFCYQTLGNSSMVLGNYDGIYTRSLLTGKLKLSRF
jgi:hypothetical protein